jgi:hypothetical protein
MFHKHEAFAFLPLIALFTGAGCQCPDGNAVDAVRYVAADFQLDTSTVAYASKAQSAPGGGAIAFDRATIVAGGSAGPATASDMVLYLMAAGCHPDESGAAVCDLQFDLALTIHDVSRHPSLPLTVALDDRSAALRLESSSSPVQVPCTGKPGVDGGLCSGGPDPGAPPDKEVFYSGIQGQLILTSLDENCTDVLSICALTAAGTFQASATGPDGEALSLTAGSITAADTLMYRHTCPN